MLTEQQKQEIAKQRVDRIVGLSIHLLDSVDLDEYGPMEIVMASMMLLASGLDKCSTAPQPAIVKELGQLLETCLGALMLADQEVHFQKADAEPPTESIH